MQDFGGSVFVESVVSCVLYKANILLCLLSIVLIYCLLWCIWAEFAVLSLGLSLALMYPAQRWRETHKASNILYRLWGKLTARDAKRGEGYPPLYIENDWSITLAAEGNLRGEQTAHGIFPPQPTPFLCFMPVKYVGLLSFQCCGVGQLD